MNLQARKTKLTATDVTHESFRFFDIFLVEMQDLLRLNFPQMCLRVAISIDENTIFNMFL
jgi:hypothetical protein